MGTKVFEVITDWPEEDGKIRQQREYVTADDNDFALVAAHFKQHCYEYEGELVRITDAITIVQHIRKEKDIDDVEAPYGE